MPESGVLVGGSGKLTIGVAVGLGELVGAGVGVLVGGTAVLVGVGAGGLVGTGLGVFIGTGSGGFVGAGLAVLVGAGLGAVGTPVSVGAATTGPAAGFEAAAVVPAGFEVFWPGSVVPAVTSVPFVAVAPAPAVAVAASPALKFMPVS